MEIQQIDFKQISIYWHLQYDYYLNQLSVVLGMFYIF